jgi:phage-related protein (TIGR01555 family)
MFREDGALLEAFQSISNRLLGFGGSRDPSGYLEINATFKMSEETLTAVYRGYKLIQKIINQLPEDANAKEIKINQGNSNINTDAILAMWRNIEVNTIKESFRGINNAFKEAGILARLYGNAYIILGINDGQEDFSQPVDELNIESIEWVAVRDRTRLKPFPNDRNLYQMTTVGRNQLPNNKQAVMTVHKSRLLPFYGTKLLGYASEKNDYEDDSIIQSLFNEFVAFTTGVGSGASMLNSHSVFKYKLNGLNRLMLQNNTEDLQKRFIGILRGLSSIKGLIFDAQNEDADFINRTYGGVDAIMIALRDIFVAVSDMPHSMLFGSPTGGAFSESGASDRYTWANTIARYQRNELLPNHTELLRLTCLGKNSPTKGVYPEDLSIEYPSSLQLTDKEQADLRKTNAETDKIYWEIKALASAEIRNRFEGSQYNSEITLLEGIEASVEPQKTEQETPQTATNDSVTIEGKKVRIRGQLLPLSEYGDDEDDTIEE